jgi:hypothetical protein
MNETKKHISLLLLFFLSCSVSAQEIRLDLTKLEQQKDFLQYLRSTISLLENKSVKEMTKKIQSKNLSDSAKQQQVAYEMMRDTTYFKRLYAYFDFLKILESKYHISKFSKEEWEEVARFGANHGIYFLSAMRRVNEKKDSLRHSPNYFPKISIPKTTDTIPRPKRIQN